MRNVTRSGGIAHVATCCVALRARRFSRLVTRRYEQALREHGLTVAQFTLLGFVALRGPVAPVALARMLDLEKSTLCRNLRPLLETKLLTCEARKGRGQALSITAGGRSTLRRALPAWKKAQRDVTELLGEEVFGRLDKMIAAMTRG